MVSEIKGIDQDFCFSDFDHETHVILVTIVSLDLMRKVMIFELRCPILKEKA